MKTAHALLYDVLMTGTARLFYDAVIRRVHETNELLCFSIEQRVGAFRVGAGWKVPIAGIARQDMGAVTQVFICAGPGGNADGTADIVVTPVTIGTSEVDGNTQMHAVAVGLFVTRETPNALSVGVGLRLTGGRRFRGHVVTFNGF